MSPRVTIQYRLLTEEQTVVLASAIEYAADDRIGPADLGTDIALAQIQSLLQSDLATTGAEHIAEFQAERVRREKLDLLERVFWEIVRQQETSGVRRAALTPMLNYVADLRAKIRDAK